MNIRDAGRRARCRVDTLFALPISFRRAFLIACIYQTMLVAIVLGDLLWLHPSPDLLAPFHHWDAKHYLCIAERGYRDCGEVFLAFFPLYPWLMRVVLPICSPVAAGILISTASSVVAHAVFLLWLSDSGLSRERIFRIALLFALTPIAVSFTMVYTEALFVAETVAFLYLLQRKNFWGAALLGGCAALTRAVGVLFLIPYLIQVVCAAGGSRRVLLNLGKGSLIGCGFLAYLSLNLFVAGDPSYYQFALKYHWSKEMLLPWQGYLAAARLVVTNFDTITPLAVRIDYLLGLIAPFVLAMVTVRWLRSNVRMHFMIVVWSWAHVLTLISVSWWLSTTRYLAGFVPLYLVLDEFCSMWRPLYWIVAIGSGIGALAYIGAFGAQGWVF